jgi:putative transposase
MLPYRPIIRETEMVRANRYFLPGFTWHLTSRCHNRELLLKYTKDRQRWQQWLYQAKKRYGLKVLNYNEHSGKLRIS